MTVIKTTLNIKNLSPDSIPLLGIFWESLIQGNVLRHKRDLVFAGDYHSDMWQRLGNIHLELGKIISGDIINGKGELAEHKWSYVHPADVMNTLPFWINTDMILRSAISKRPTPLELVQRKSFQWPFADYRHFSADPEKPLPRSYCEHRQRILYVVYWKLHRLGFWKGTELNAVLKQMNLPMH